MICPYCNSSVEDGNTFCTTCGKPITSQNIYGGQQDPYGTGAGQYGQPSTQQNAYSSPQGYGQQGYGQQDPYGAGAGQYVQPGAPQSQYGGPQNTYGGQQNTYMPQGYPYPGVPPMNTGSSIPDVVIGPNGQQLGMNWFKFIIYVQLFLTSLGALYNAYQLLSGKIYDNDQGVTAEQIFRIFPSLKTVGFVSGILFLVVAGGAIFTRFQLAGFKKNGPMFYFIVIGIIIFANFIYVIAAVSEVKKYGFPASSIVQPSIVGQIIGYVILVVCNIIYFNNRKKLFVK
ncbi:MAG: hypothetical protein J6Z74_01410 [Eubacterium sp.]|nr:hypothetical protein [Eubacterium sp.]